MDGKFVLLSIEQFRGLNEYSTSRPTGVYEGKCWKTYFRGQWFLFWYSYGDCVNCAIHHRRIMIGRLKPRKLPPYPEH